MKKHKKMQRKTEPTIPKPKLEDYLTAMKVNGIKILSSGPITLKSRK